MTQETAQTDQATRAAVRSFTAASSALP
jgi:hypothetical protein